MADVPQNGSGDPAAPARRMPNPYVVAALLCTMYAASFIDRQMISILAEPIKADLGLSDTQLGLLGGFMFALFYTVFGVPVAWLADRRSRVRIITLACALWSLCSAACGLAQNFGTLALARIGVGVGEAGGNAPSYSLLSDYFQPARRGRALAIFSLGAPLGLAGGSAFGAWVAAEYGWRVAFFATGLPGLALALVLILVIREPKRGGLDKVAATGERPAGMGDTVRRFVSFPPLTLVCLASGSSAFVGMGTVTWLPAYLMRIKGMTLGDLSLHYSLLMGVTMCIGILAGGFLVDYFGSRDKRAYAFVPAVGFLVGLPFTVAAIIAPDWRLALALLGVPLVILSTYLPPALAFVQNAVAVSARATASALLLLVINIVGTGCGPLFVGLVSDLAEAKGLERPLEVGLAALLPFYLVTAALFFLAARSIGRHRIAAID
ncbi:MFS transporter [soil metagenome]